MTISKNKRYEIFRRDKHTCRYCGRAAPNVELTIDHVVPRTLGGSDEPENLVTACRDCNSGKAATIADAAVVADVDSDVVRWRRAIIVAAQENTLAQEESRRLLDGFDTHWTRWNGHARRDGKWRDSVLHMLGRGLTFDDLIEFVERTSVSGSTDLWRYFCGCCWKRIRSIEERARELLDDPPPASPDYQPTISTVWTDDEIQAALEHARGVSVSLPADVVAHIACRHQSSGHCPDALCRLEYATSLAWFALFRSSEDAIKRERDAAVMDAADDLEVA